MEIDGLEFDLTCEACPEQYDVYKDRDVVGYIRLRHGYLSCECPDYTGELVYSYKFRDSFQGCFSSQYERNEHLSKCAESINKWIEDSEED